MKSDSFDSMNGDRVQLVYSSYNHSWKARTVEKPFRVSRDSPFLTVATLYALYGCWIPLDQLGDSL